MLAHIRAPSGGGKNRKHTKYTEGQRQHTPHIELPRQGLGMTQISEILCILRMLIRQRWLKGLRIVFQIHAVVFQPEVIYVNSVGK